MKRILVIDDEEWLREMVHIALAQKGYHVTEAENGAVGIEEARKQLPDLILCDVNMDKVDGYLTLSSLRNEPATAGIPFILWTMAAFNDPVQREKIKLFVTTLRHTPSPSILRSARMGLSA